MQVSETDAQMLEKCAVLSRDTFSVGQMDIVIDSTSKLSSSAFPRSM